MADNTNIVNQVPELFYGEQEQYNSATKKPNGIYFTDDTHRIYVGDKDFSNPLVENEDGDFIPLHVSNDVFNSYKTTHDTEYAEYKTQVADAIQEVEDKIPTKLPNPNKLTITQNGSTLGEYDGSEALTIDIPESGAGGDTPTETVEDWFSMEVGDTTTYGIRWLGAASIPELENLSVDETIEVFTTVDNLGQEYAFTIRNYDDMGHMVYIVSPGIHSGLDTSIEKETFKYPWYQLLIEDSSNLCGYMDPPNSMGVTSITITSVADWAKPYLEIYTTKAKQTPELIKEGYGVSSIQGTSATAAGSMAFSITAFDTTAQTYTLDSVEGLEVGMRVSIQLKKNYDDCGTITEISGNNVKLSTFYYTEGEDVIQEGSHLIALDYPELGTYRFGTAATALGYETKAGGIGAFATGWNTNAHGKYAVAFGNSTKAGYAATALGRDTNASGRMSLALGDLTTSSGQCSISGGYNSVASGDGAIAIGLNSNATAFYSTARGNNVEATQGCSTAIGTSTHAQASNSFAMGENNYVRGTNSFVGGTASNANGDNSFVFGDNVTSIGNHSFSSGLGNSSHGDASVSFGEGNTAQGARSFVAGTDSTVIGENGVAFGESNTVNSKNAVALGSNNMSSNENSFVVGQNNIASGAGSFAGGNQSRATGNFSIAFGEKVTASGNWSFAAPYSKHRVEEYVDPNASNADILAAYKNCDPYEKFTLAKGGQSVALGRENVALGAGSVAIGYENISTGWGSATMGRGLISTTNETTTVGRFNNPDNNTDAVFVVGTGSNDSNRKNGFWVKADGTSSLHQVIDDKIAAAGVGGGSSSNAIFSELNESTNLTQLNPGAYVVANGITGSVPYHSYNEETGMETTDGVSIELVAGDLIYCEHEFYSEDTSFYYVIIRIQSVNYNRFIQVNDTSGMDYQEPYNVYLGFDRTYEITTPKVIPTDYVVYSVDPEGNELSFEDGIYTLVSESSECAFTFGNIYTGRWHEEWDEETGEDTSWYDSLYLPTGSIVIANSYSVYDYTYTNYNIMTPNGGTINLQKTEYEGDTTYTEVFNSNNQITFEVSYDDGSTSSFKVMASK